MNRLLFVCLVFFAAPASVRAQTPLQDVKAGEAALDRDDWKNAESLFDRALRAHPGNSRLEASALHGRGEARLQLEQWAQAKDDLDRAVQLDPRDAGAFAARGMARKALGDDNGLLLDAAQAAKLNPKGYAQFQKDAQSTVLYHRMLLVFAALGGIALCVGAVPLVRVLVRITRAGG